jgi:hypothetical protein
MCKKSGYIDSGVSALSVDLDYSPFSEQGQCYKSTCDGKPLDQVSYGKCCCGIGNTWMADTGDFTCNSCPTKETFEYDALCDSAYEFEYEFSV